MDNQIKKYISLEEAKKYCKYSQEYLGLRARQGKLKAVKFGRNWLTTKEWLEEYLKHIEDYRNNINSKTQCNENVSRYIIPGLSAPRFGFVVALVFVLFATSIVFGKESFKNVFEDLDPYVQKVSRVGDIVVGQGAVKVVAIGDTLVDGAIDVAVEGAVKVSNISLPSVSMPRISSLPDLSWKQAGIGDIFE